MLPQKKLEIWGLQTAGNALKLSILPSPCYKHFTIPSGGPFGSWGGGGVRAHPAHPPCLRAWWTAILDAPLGFCRRRPRFRICRNSNGQKLSSNTLSTQLPNVLSNYLICFNLGALYKMFTFWKSSNTRSSQLQRLAQTRSPSPTCEIATQVKHLIFTATLPKSTPPLPDLLMQDRLQSFHAVKGFGAKELYFKTCGRRSDNWHANCSACLTVDQSSNTESDTKRNVSFLENISLHNFLMISLIFLRNSF